MLRKVTRGRRTRLFAFRRPLLGVLFLTLPAACWAQAESWISATAGAYSPFDAETRSDFGVLGAAQLGLDVRVHERLRFAFIEVGWQSTTGQVLSPDPTFEWGDTKLTVIPVTIGIRGSPGAETKSHRARFFWGVGWQMAFVTVDDDLFGKHEGPTHGLHLEAGPRLALADDWNVSFRARFNVLANANLGSIFDEIPVSGSALEVALSRLVVSGASNHSRGGF